MEQVGGGVFRGQGDGHLPEPGEAGVLVDDVPELRVHIQEIELTGAIGECVGDAVDELREYVRRKGIEEIDEAGTWREFEGESVLTSGFEGTAGIAGLLPSREVRDGDGVEIGVVLYGDAFAEGKLRCDKDDATFAGSEVDEGVVLYEKAIGRFEPAIKHGLCERWWRCVVGGLMGIVWPARGELGNESAGVEVRGAVERMAVFSRNFSLPGFTGEVDAEGNAGFFEQMRHAD